MNKRFRVNLIYFLFMIQCWKKKSRMTLFFPFEKLMVIGFAHFPVICMNDSNFASYFQLQIVPKARKDRNQLCVE